MAVNAASKFLSIGRLVTLRCMHTTNVIRADKPMPDPYAFNVGYEKIRLEAEKVGEDPFDSANRDNPPPLEGSGTKADPFIVPSRNDARVVCTFLPGRDGPPPAFWVTKENGGRCPITGQHYKLHKIEGDKWGIDELDLFKH